MSRSTDSDNDNRWNQTERNDPSACCQILLSQWNGLLWNSIKMQKNKIVLTKDELTRIQDRFWSKVEKTETCWNWKGAKTCDNGYGQIRLNNRNSCAHRIAYELINGQVPNGLELDHLCRNPSCVNPNHLEIVTRKENQRRGFGVSGINSRKTYCLRGHPLSGSNLVPNRLRQGKRECRACKSIHSREYRRKFGRNP